MAFESTYRPEEVERIWRERWEATRAFHAPEPATARHFSIVIPPPNVTGVLHIGHALNSTLQDILVRWRRMQGRSVLWVPGTDHAGIATQNVVEKQLAAQGTDRHAIGREEFVRRVWLWKEESGGKILNQLQRLGCSCDWERQRFTLDEGLSRAVRQVFISLHAEGLIYRAERITNWCPRCHTALSDLEVENESTPGHLFHIRYPFAEGRGRHRGRDDAARDDPRGHGGRRPPRGPALPRRRRPDARAARRTRSGSYPSSPTPRWTRPSAPAPSRSPRPTTPTTSRPGGVTAWRRRRSWTTRRG